MDPRATLSMKSGPVHTVVHDAVQNRKFKTEISRVFLLARLGQGKSYPFAVNSSVPKYSRQMYRVKKLRPHKDFIDNAFSHDTTF